MPNHKTGLPTQFPAYHQLRLNGYWCYQDLEKLTKQDLLKLIGIGNVSADKIIEARDKFFKNGD